MAALVKVYRIRHTHVPARQSLYVVRPCPATSTAAARMKAETSVYMITTSIEMKFRFLRMLRFNFLKRNPVGRVKYDWYIGVVQAYQARMIEYPYR
jgi:hypothetical protein